MLHVIVFSRKLGGREGSRTDGEITIHFFPGEVRSSTCIEFGGLPLFSSTPMAPCCKSGAAYQV